jgi:hypothetical protein
VSRLNIALDSPEDEVRVIVTESPLELDVAITAVAEAEPS